MPSSNFQPIQLLDPDCCYKFTYLLANSADPDQLALQKPTHLDLHCLQGQGVSGFSRTRVRAITTAADGILNFFLNIFQRIYVFTFHVNHLPSQANN